MGSIHQIVGVHNGSNLPGSHLYACYQMAVLLVEVPQWGLPPRISATNEVPEEKIKLDLILRKFCIGKNKLCVEALLNCCHSSLCIAHNLRRCKIMFSKYFH